MIRGIYSAATALDSASQAQDVVSHNLAHAATPGYRRRGLSHETFDRVLSRAANTGPLMGTQVSQGYTVFRPGALQQTGNPTDLALDGDSFFVLQGPDGPVFTRNGAFRRGAGGELQNQSGLPVLGTVAPVVIPANASRITVGRDGTVQADGAAVGQLQLARFSNAERLISNGTTFFRDPGNAGRGTGNSPVLQGYREASNVEPANEMVAMIAGSRYFEAAQRALRALSDSIQLNTRPQG
jgi:flagellar basal body rod protein FlgG